jgi:DNA-binding GntR family transcriptional regulator
MGSSFVAIQPSALRRDVAEVLRSAILDGRFKPGEELSDSKLAAEFSVSRGPVREALFLLAEEGLVIHRHHRGFGIPNLERKDLVQIANVRLPLEVLALEGARQRATEADLEQLMRLKADLLEAFAAGGLRVCARPDLAFHAAVWKIAGNPWLEAALRRVAMPFFAYVSAFDLGRRDHSAELMESMHLRYVEFIGGRSSESAQECAAFHLGLGEGC